MIDMRKIVDQINDPDRLPEDDHDLVSQEIAYLNRIDQVWTCDAIIHDGPLYALVEQYCGLPEHDPFTARCWDHTPGNLPTGHM